MLDPLGPVIAPPDTPPHAWAALPDERRPLVLAPGEARGWFGGRPIVALDPLDVGAVDLPSATAVLDAALASPTPVLAAVLAAYDGAHTLARYPRGLLLDEDGWRPWGDWRRTDVPAPPPAPASLPGTPLAADVLGDLDQAAFVERVLRLQESIRAGDVYVLNLTYRVRGRPLVPAEEAFAAMAGLRAPMTAFWRLPEFALVSASPERFVRLEGGIAEVHPIKGTHPRGSTAEEDVALASALRDSEKERAEHVMIVDLERNDLGRVARPGGVEVDPLFEVVPTPYAHQMVSAVRARVRPGVTAHDLLAATFPCGSVTGAPKIAAMRHIRRLETSSRGAYTGSLLVAVPGALDSSVLIRTAEVNGDEIVYGTGGGITIDSDPAEEWVETVLKLAPVLGDPAPRVALRETCRVAGGRVPLLPYHLARFASGGCGRTLLARAGSAAEEAAANARGARLALTVAPGGDVHVTVDDRRSSLDVPGGPVLVPVASASAPLPAGAAKPAARDPWDAAQAEAVARGGHVALLVAEDGRLLDAATASVWIVRDGVLHTPPAPPAVAGVARAYLLAHARTIGATARVSELTLDDLARADEVFLTNAYAGAVAVRGRGGPVSALVAGLFGEVYGPNRENASAPALKST